MVARLPDHLPIMAARIRDGGASAVYCERELVEPVDLCTSDGDLAPAAVGWSRRPLVRANLHGGWPRNKRWNFWNWIGPRGVLSVTLADIDYAAFCQVTCIDFETGRTIGVVAPAWPGSFTMPEEVERSVRFEGRRVRYANVQEAGVMTVHLGATATSGEPLVADFVVRTPPGHESLNVVVPWTRRRFQLNSKHAALPCEGTVRVGEATWTMTPDAWHGVQDFGRGRWPYQSFWNWGVATGAVDGMRVAVNVGAKWTTGTGANENGVLVDGRLTKVMEDLRWDYDPADWMRPWRVRAAHSNALDLTLEPIVLHHVHTSVGLLSTRGVCCFGRWHGTLHVDDRTLRIANLLGWAEEFVHRW